MLAATLPSAGSLFFLLEDMGERLTNTGWLYYTVIDEWRLARKNEEKR